MFEQRIRACFAIVHLGNKLWAFASERPCSLLILEYISHYLTKSLWGCFEYGKRHPGNLLDVPANRRQDVTDDEATGGHCFARCGAIRTDTELI